MCPLVKSKEELSENNFCRLIFVRIFSSPDICQDWKSFSFFFIVLEVGYY